MGHRCAWLAKYRDSTIEVKEQAQLLKLRAEAIEKERARVRRTIGLEIEAKERLALLLAGVHAHCNRMGSSLKFPVRTVSAARRECLLLLGPALKDADWRSIKPMERAKFWKGFFEEARQEALS
ncbi:MAG TPA: hypothetical protein VI953_03425 [Candidatus Paceibacterota bacterium]